jgi:hypothetical protein
MFDMNTDKEYLEIMETIEQIKNFDLCQILNNFVDKSYWNLQLQSYFKGVYIENLTDFNYDRCFTYAINLSNSDARLVSCEFDEYINSHGVFYRLVIKISLIGNYAKYLFYKYSPSIENSSPNVKLEVSLAPFITEHNIFVNKIENFISDIGFCILPKEILDKEVSGIKLELIDQVPTVEEILFN